MGGTGASHRGGLRSDSVVTIRRKRKARDTGRRDHGGVRFVLLIDENVFLTLREEGKVAGVVESRPGGRSVFLIDENRNV